MQYETENKEDNNLMKRETEYRLQLAHSKRLLKMGLIKQSELKQIDTILRQKYQPALSAFISENT
ncbi:MAG: hypothetical protein K6G33_02115 [Ruminococcus sp.]|uniref:SHOCT domain-containing protein n=1 Tax=Ruminococcus sp. TaxID=41978 RepID=UPI0025F7F45A|nr:SHOCT domain-containing protein [Ruminococcus sp.]MCR5599526.1 hypothetical protein [Ruminococcus sp.]